MSSLEEQRHQSRLRLERNFAHIIEKYGQHDNSSDVIDLDSLSIIRDRGQLSKQPSPKIFGYSRLAATSCLDSSDLGPALLPTSNSNDSDTTILQDNAGDDEISAQSPNKDLSKVYDSAVEAIKNDILSHNFESAPFSYDYGRRNSSSDSDDEENRSEEDSNYGEMSEYDSDDASNQSSVYIPKIWKGNVDSSSRVTRQSLSESGCFSALEENSEDIIPNSIVETRSQVKHTPLIARLFPNLCLSSHDSAKNDANSSGAKSPSCQSHGNDVKTVNKRLEFQESSDSEIFGMTFTLPTVVMPTGHFNHASSHFDGLACENVHSVASVRMSNDGKACADNLACCPTRLSTPAKSTSKNRFTNKIESRLSPYSPTSLTTTPNPNDKPMTDVSVDSLSRHTSSTKCDNTDCATHNCKSHSSNCISLSKTPSTCKERTRKIVRTPYRGTPRFSTEEILAIFQSPEPLVIPGIPHASPMPRKINTNALGVPPARIADEIKEMITLSRATDKQDDSKTQQSYDPNKKIVRLLPSRKASTGLVAEEVGNNDDDSRISASSCSDRELADSLETVLAKSCKYLQSDAHVQKSTDLKRISCINSDRLAAIVHDSDIARISSPPKRRCLSPNAQCTQLGETREWACSTWHLKSQIGQLSYLEPMHENLTNRAENKNGNEGQDNLIYHPKDSPSTGKVLILTNDSKRTEESHSCHSPVLPYKISRSQPFEQPTEIKPEMVASNIDGVRSCLHGEGIVEQQKNFVVSCTDKNGASKVSVRRNNTEVCRAHATDVLRPNFPHLSSKLSVMVPASVPVPGLPSTHQLIELPSRVKLQSVPTQYNELRDDVNMYATPTATRQMKENPSPAVQHSPKVITGQSRSTSSTPAKVVNSTMPDISVSIIESSTVCDSEDSDVTFKVIDWSADLMEEKPKSTRKHALTSVECAVSNSQKSSRQRDTKITDKMSKSRAHCINQCYRETSVQHASQMTGKAEQRKCKDRYQNATKSVLNIESSTRDTRKHLSDKRHQKVVQWLVSTPEQKSSWHRASYSHVEMSVSPDSSVDSRKPSLGTSPPSTPLDSTYLQRQPVQATVSPRYSREQEEPHIVQHNTRSADSPAPWRSAAVQTVINVGLHAATEKVNSAPIFLKRLLPTNLRSVRRRWHTTTSKQQASDSSEDDEFYIFMPRKHRALYMTRGSSTSSDHLSGDSLASTKPTRRRQPIRRAKQCNDISSSEYDGSCQSVSRSHLRRNVSQSGKCKVEPASILGSISRQRISATSDSDNVVDVSTKENSSFQMLHYPKRKNLKSCSSVGTPSNASTFESCTIGLRKPVICIPRVNPNEKLKGVLSGKHQNNRPIYQKEMSVELHSSDTDNELCLMPKWNHRRYMKTGRNSENRCQDLAREQSSSGENNLALKSDQQVTVTCDTSTFRSKTLSRDDTENRFMQKFHRLVRKPRTTTSDSDNSGCSNEDDTQVSHDSSSGVSSLDQAGAYRSDPCAISTMAAPYQQSKMEGNTVAISPVKLLRCPKWAEYHNRRSVEEKDRTAVRRQRDDEKPSSSGSERIEQGKKHRSLVKMPQRDPEHSYSRQIDRGEDTSSRKTPKRELHSPSSRKMEHRDIHLLNTKQIESQFLRTRRTDQGEKPNCLVKTPQREPQLISRRIDQERKDTSLVNRQKLWRDLPRRRQRNHGGEEVSLVNTRPSGSYLSCSKQAKGGEKDIGIVGRQSHTPNSATEHQHRMGHGIGNMAPRVSFMDSSCEGPGNCSKAFCFACSTSLIVL
ncbi:PREDICTED: uncharacterized protein LOC106815929 [Priapulus caudatus]|uniref:Uncharacterized protein LOC106815929 n=1 Tax=Priapulus caudatus TaxID=37621 RepID=A0ABM1EUS7_PRICU|nr:PREDICTED: uncharacterized protein LOC106815929 [Priapulus caudatus]